MNKFIVSQAPWHRAALSPLLLGAIFLLTSMGSPLPVFGQTGTAQKTTQSSNVVQPAGPENEEPYTPYSQAQLEQIFAPVALYPDALLAQVLMASTYPVEIVQAARWSEANPDLKGDAAVEAVADRVWEPSVKSLVAFPDLIASLNEDLDHTQAMGEAFLNQKDQVMDTIQILRRRAREAGNLESNEQQIVSTQTGGQTIVIEPATPNVVYVPYYNPTVVYGGWLWPSYPPYSYYYYPGPGSVFVSGFFFGAGVYCANAIYGGFSWRSRNVYVNVNRYNWLAHRRAEYIGSPIWRHSPMYRDRDFNRYRPRAGGGDRRFGGAPGYDRRSDYGRRTSPVRSDFSRRSGIDNRPSGRFPGSTPGERRAVPGGTRDPGFAGPQRNYRQGDSRTRVLPFQNRNDGSRSSAPGPNRLNAPRSSMPRSSTPSSERLNAPRSSTSRYSAPSSGRLNAPRSSTSRFSAPSSGRLNAPRSSMPRSSTPSSGTRFSPSRSSAPRFSSPSRSAPRYSAPSSGTRFSPSRSSVPRFSSPSRSSPSFSGRSSGGGGRGGSIGGGRMGGGRR